MRDDDGDSPALAATHADTPELAATAAATPGLERTAAATASDAALALPALDRVDRYVIKKRLGAGGMGVVYVATDPELGRDVAIKMIKSGAHAERLKREAQALARLDHRNVVTVYDVGEHAGRAYVAMALVDGQNLGEWLGAEHTTGEIMNVLLQAAQGIIAAHAAGLIHRDLKPDNIFVARDGNVLVGDFGLARDAADDDSPGFDAIGPAMSLTQTGHVLGTPAYMAPEQAAGEASERSDQFSYCVTAYEALYGTRPFVGATFEEILDKVDSAVFEAPKRRRKVPSHVAAAIRRGLDADPAKRWPSMKALVAAMEPPRRRVWPWVAGGGVLVTGGVATALVLGGGDRDAAAACAPVRDEMAATWNPTKKAAFAAHLRKRLTAKATEEVTARIDGYATRWVGQRVDTCTAKHTGALDTATATARVDCLSLARIALDQTLAAVHAETEPDVMLTSKRVTALPAIEACATDDALRLAMTGNAHQQLMGDIMVAEAGTDPKLFEPLRARAEAAADVPAQLEIALAEARKAISQRVFPLAETAIQRGMPLAEQLRVEGARVRLLAFAAQARCLQSRDPESYLAMAETAAKRLDPDRNALEHTTVLEARAACYARGEDPSPAIPVFEELIARSIARHGEDAIEHIELRSDLALILRRLGRGAEARAQEEIVEKSLGAHATDTLSEAHRAATASSQALMDGDLHAAIKHQRRAVLLFPTNELKARALGMLAMYHDVLLEWRIAADTQTQLLETLEGEPSSDAVDQLRGESHGWRGAARMYLGEVEPASADFEAALPVAQKYEMTEILAVAQIGLGRVWLARKEPARAVRYLQEGLATHTKLGEAAMFRVGLAQFALAQAQWDLGDKPAARETAKLAEISVTKGIAQSRESKIGSHGLAFRQKRLDEIVAWRDAHR